jgi:arginyl-tRNA synthetase
VIIFNKNEAVRFEGDTGPYLLYSYARANSILGKSKKPLKYSISKINDSERLLLNELSRFPDVVMDSCLNYEVSNIAHYSYNLCQIFNEFYHSCPVIGSDHEGFRLELVNSFVQVLGNALNLLGIPVLKEM